MPFLRIIAPAVIALVGLAACSTFDSREVGYLRSTGLPPQIVRKMERGAPLTPPEVIALARHRVPDSFTLRHLEDAGVNYLVTTSDVVRMRRGGVSARVIDVLLAECDDFASRYGQHPVDVSVGMWWVDSPYIGSDLYFDSWW
jgi:hypothetical protein